MQTLRSLRFHCPFFLLQVVLYFIYLSLPERGRQKTEWSHQNMSSSNQVLRVFPRRIIQNRAASGSLLSTILYYTILYQTIWQQRDHLASPHQQQGWILVSPSCLSDLLRLLSRSGTRTSTVSPTALQNSQRVISLPSSSLRELGFLLRDTCSLLMLLDL